ncbi:MAG: rhodanese-like domain-containing protein [Erysipelotrichaceae bacterium]|jgi:rhodanese-related sulfurtransferase|nr:rhodanese-like domain-containing protein [Erysipelotrichaceae bacterium]
MKKLFACLCLLLSACQSAAYTKISAQEAKKMMEEVDNIMIIDVRQPDEYEQGHIPGAILLPLDTIQSKKPEQLDDLDQTILVYCRSGRRSKQAADQLIKLGYTHIYDFGGIIDWPYEIVTD